MAIGNVVEIAGNLTRDCELRFTPAGVAVGTFGIAQNHRYQRNNEWVEEVNFFDVVCWQKLAENAAESLTKGMRVIVTGRLQYRSWEDNDGNKRNKIEIVADEVAVSLRWATVDSVTRNPKEESRYGDDGGYGGGNGGGNARQPARSGGGASRPQAPKYEPEYDEEPF